MARRGKPLTFVEKATGPAVLALAVALAFGPLLYFSLRRRADVGDEDDLLTPEEIRDSLIGVAPPEDARAALMAAEPTPHYLYIGGNIVGATPEWSAWFESLGPLSDQEFFQVWGVSREEYSGFLI